MSTRLQAVKGARRTPVPHALRPPVRAKRGSSFWVRLVYLLMGIVAVSVSAASWTSRLADGRRIQVDPNTNRVTVFPERGNAQQLWDGVHRLEDGSTITIRSGVMVPTKAIVELRQRLPTPHLPESDALCQQLVRKVCGLHDECVDRPACAPARQLLQMSQDPARDAAEEPDPGATPWALEQCRQALQDEAFFAACDKAQRGKAPTPCEQLLDKVCGPQQECRQQPRCSLAKQMLEMEAEERRSATNPDALTFTSHQCQEALDDEEFFNPCQP
ncbi:MAG: hypothetical protein ACFCVA_06615 [Gammaproteobacteria bacterium]